MAKRFHIGFYAKCKNVMKCICAAYVDSRKKHFEPPHVKTNTMIFMPSDDSYQPGHPPSLISLRCALSGYIRTQFCFRRTALTLIRLGECPGWSESSLGAQIILLVLSCCGSIFIHIETTSETIAYGIVTNLHTRNLPGVSVVPKPHLVDCMISPMVFDSVNVAKCL